MTSQSVGRLNFMIRQEKNLYNILIEAHNEADAAATTPYTASTTRTKASKATSATFSVKSSMTKTTVKS
jgi:hypothetical protein